jgi:GntR family transcriptional regulator
MDLRVDRQSELPLGVQLAQQLRSQLGSGALSRGDLLPSVREAARAAGVNVNTVRAVYARLEQEGLLRSVQGRGTFVAELGGHGDEATERRELRAQIAALELQLARRPPPPSEAEVPLRPGATSGRLLSAHELRLVRDELTTRLHEIDAERAELLQRLRELPSAEPAPDEERSSHSTPSLAGARVRVRFA